MEAELAELQADVRELSAKKRDARARSIIADLDERLDAVAQEIQKVIEHALVNIGADNPKVTKRGKEMMSSEAHATVYSIQAEHAADELRGEVAQDDGTPEAGDRRRSCAATLMALLDTLTPDHAIQEQLRGELAVPLEEARKEKAAEEKAKAALEEKVTDRKSVV